MKPRNRYRGLTLFVTVGTTRFDELIERIFTDQTIDQLIDYGFVKMIVQAGKSDYDIQRIEDLRVGHNLDIEIYDYKSSILDDIERADVVIGHAGAGTCLETLRKNKRLLVVVNNNLMDNHQNELADQLAHDEYVVQTDAENLNKNLAFLCSADTKLAQFPPKNPEKFEQIFSEALKKVNSRL